MRAPASTSDTKSDGNVPTISVVVPTYQRADRCAQLLRSLATQTLAPSDFEVLAVDDCSRDGTWSLLGRLAGELPYRLRPLRTAANSGGPAVARNLGWRHARAPYVAFVDDDCTVEPTWLEAGVETFRCDPGLGVVQGRTRPPDGYDPSTAPAWAYTIDVRGPSPHFEGCNVFYRRAALASAGGFPEDIGWWAEDAAAGWRVVELGWKQGFAPGAVVVHDAQLRGWPWHVRWGLREANLIRVAAQHPGFRAAVFWRPWALRRTDAAFALAATSVALATRWRPAALGALPYLWLYRGMLRERHAVRLGAQVVAVDAARTAGHVRGAISSRTLVI